MLQRISVMALLATAASLICLIYANLNVQWASPVLLLVLICSIPGILRLMKSTRLSEARDFEFETLQQKLAAVDGKALINDTTHRQLIEQNQRVLDRYQASQQLVDDVSHDLRTPLSVIKGYSEMLRDGMAGPLSPDQLRFSQLIVDRTRDVAQMIDDLLDTTKLRAGSMRADRAVCDIASIFKTLHPLVRDRARANNIDWREQINPGAERVFADFEKISRVLAILVLRAISVSPDEGQITISATLDASGGIRVDVTDYGPGISQGNMDLLRRGFERVGNSSARGKGPGVSLNAASELILINLGQMYVSSEETKGCTFSFTLPANDPASILDGQFHYLSRLGTPPGTFTILIVAPQGSGGDFDQLRAFLSSSAHPTDLIMMTGDGSALLLCGYSAKPQSWQGRLRNIGQNLDQANPRQKLPAFDVEIAAVLPYPTSPSEALSIVEANLGNPRSAPRNCSPALKADLAFAAAT